MLKALAALFLILFAQYSLAATCPQVILEITGKEVSIPDGFEKGILVDNLTYLPPSHVANFFLETQGKKMIFNEQQKDNFQSYKESTSIRWLINGEVAAAKTPSACLQKYSLNIPAVPPSPPPSINDCYPTAEAEYERIKGRRGDDNFSFIAFCSDQTTFQHGRSYGVKGDPIYIALYDNATLGKPTFEIPTCSLEQEGVSLYNKADVSKLGRQAGSFELSPPVIRTCFDSQVVINLIDRDKGDKILRAHVLNQHTRYHGSFMLGTLFTDKISHKYLAGNNGTGTTVIRDEGPFNQGPVHIISLLLHGLPHYLTTDSKPYLGRDILHDNGWKDRLGLMLGVGIEKPQDNLTLGLTYELMRGINITYSTNWSRVTSLDGVKVGDTIAAGTVVPTSVRWERYNSAGISIDFGYVTGLYGK